MKFRTMPPYCHVVMKPLFRHLALRCICTFYSLQAVRAPNFSPILIMGLRWFRWVAQDRSLPCLQHLSYNCQVGDDEPIKPEMMAGQPGCWPRHFWPGDLPLDTLSLCQSIMRLLHRRHWIVTKFAHAKRRSHVSCDHSLRKSKHLST